MYDELHLEVIRKAVDSIRTSKGTATFYRLSLSTNRCKLFPLQFDPAGVGGCNGLIIADSCFRITGERRIRPRL